MLGTIIGAFIMSVLTNGLRIMSVAQEWQIVVTGVIIILAVYADILRREARVSGRGSAQEGGLTCKAAAAGGTRADETTQMKSPRRNIHVEEMAHRRSRSAR